MRPLFPACRALLALLALGACRDAPVPPPASPAPPTADFVLAAGDSTFWVSSAEGSVRVRGAPLDLVRVDGRLYELYVADDDRSFEDAVLIGQRVYRRDLVTGDSLLVYEDTIVPGLARQYARLHPDDRPLDPDDEASEQPLWRAVATLDLGDVHGPFLSYSIHTDVERADAPLWHTSRRGVLDLRTGGAASLRAIAGAATADVERQRTLMLASAVDSVKASRDDRGARARAMLPFYRLDPASFFLTTVDGALAIAYAAPGAGGGDAGHLLPLPPIPIAEPDWWASASASLPVASSDGARDVWRHAGYAVVVLYDSAGGPARLTLRDSTSREFPVARVPAPATRIVWLDQPAIDTVARRALARAFDESSSYDEDVRVAALQKQLRRVSPRITLAHRRASRPHPTRPPYRAQPA
jgi:hypothetical protein